MKGPVGWSWGTGYPYHLCSSQLAKCSPFPVQVPGGINSASGHFSKSLGKWSLSKREPKLELNLRAT